MSKSLIINKDKLFIDKLKICKSFRLSLNDNESLEDDNLINDDNIKDNNDNIKDSSNDNIEDSNNNIDESQKQLLTYKRPSLLNICTYTISINITDNKTHEIELHLLSRFVPVYKENDIKTKTIEGCIIGFNSYTEHKYSDLSRGITVLKKKYPKSIFNNQLTIDYKYCDFKQINIKIFNGCLHLTGIKDNPWETNHIINQMFNLFKTIKYKIILNKQIIKFKNELINAKTEDDIINITSNYEKFSNYVSILDNFNFIIVYDENKNDIVYYRNNLDYFNLEYYLKNKKNYSTGKWLSMSECELLLNNYNTTIENYYENIESILSLIMTHENSNIPLTQKYKLEIYKYLKQFHYIKKIKESYFYLPDILFITFIKKYITDIKKILKMYHNNINQTFYTDSKVISRLKVFNKDIIKQCEEQIKKGNYIFTTDMKMNSYDFKILKKDIQMIECNFKTGYGHKLKELSNVLMNKYDIYNTYNPNNGHAGIIVSFYYNKKYIDAKKKPGKCYCDGFCYSKKPKNRDKDSCTILTIIIFRPSNIIIMGGKKIEEAQYAYTFINNVIKQNLNEVCYDISNSELHNNLLKKISKKQPLFIKKSNIIFK